LIDAIDASNATPEADTINLASNGLCTVLLPLDPEHAGPDANSFPPIGGERTIVGNGTTIQRDAIYLFAPFLDQPVGRRRRVYRGAGRTPGGV